jgi:hypothetical protein
VGERAINLLAGFTTVALVLVIVSGRQTPNVVREFGGAYARLIRAATGRG